MSAALSLVPRSVIGTDADIDLLAKLVRDFEESEETSWKARELAERDRDFYDGNQLTSEEIAALRKRRQPPSVNNYIQRKIDLLRGMERRGRSDPKAYPRTPTQAARADVATQTLRFVADDNRFDVIRSAVYENMLIEGFGGAEVVVEAVPTPDGALMGHQAAPSAPEYEVRINYFPWDRLFYDPHSRHPGFADARFLGSVIWMDRVEALERWPGTEGILDASFVGVSASQTYDDKPRWSSSWADARRSRIRVVQMHFRRGADWWTATFTRGGFLEAPAPSPYVDRHGRPTCPLHLRSAYIDRENNRYGLVRSMISQQEAINKRESKLLHLLNVNQVVMDQGAVDDVDGTRAEVAKPDGVIVKNPGFEFEIRRDQSEVQGHFQLLQYSVAQMNANGPNAAMSGKDPREQSGRAIIAQQTGGMAESEPHADSLRQWTHKVMEACWMRVRQYVTAEKTIRITGNQGAPQFVQLNHPVTLQEELSQMPPDQAQMIAQRLMLQPGDPRLQVVLRVENTVDDLDVDITIEEGPDVPTLQNETWQAFVQLPQEVLVKFPPEAFISMNPALRQDDKDHLLDMLKQQQAQAQQAQQQAQAAAQAMQQATIADKQAQAADRQASAVSKLHNMARDHAQDAATPLVPGIGPVPAEQNPLLLQAQQPPQMPPTQGP